MHVLSGVSSVHDILCGPDCFDVAQQALFVAGNLLVRKHAFCSAYPDLLYQKGWARLTHVYKPLGLSEPSVELLVQCFEDVLSSIQYAAEEALTFKEQSRETIKWLQVGVGLFSLRLLKRRSIDAATACRGAE